MMMEECETIDDRYMSIMGQTVQRIKVHYNAIDRIVNVIKELEEKGGDPDVIAEYGKQLNRFQDIIEKLKGVGFPGIDYGDYEHLKKYKTTLEKMFLNRYADFSIGDDTVEGWQLMLQSKFDSIADKYNYELGLQEEARLIKYKEENTSDTWQDNQNETRTSDLPDSNISLDEYAGNRSKSDSKNHTNTSNKVISSAGELGVYQIKSTFNKPILGNFIEEFQDIFMGIWRI